MTADCLEDARERVRAEREAVREKRSAYDRFLSRLDDLSPTTTRERPAAITAGTTCLSRASGGSGSGCAEVRTAFTETVRPHSVADLDRAEPLLQTVRRELSDSIACALAPRTETELTTELREAVVTEAESRRAELGTTDAALEREADQLDAASDALVPVREWLLDANETPLTGLGFDALRDRHRTLATHRETCDRVVADRQPFLQGTTSRGAKTGVTHRSLVGYLYQDLPVDHPILSTGARLADLCADGQRTVRDHLVRRV